MYYLIRVCLLLSLAIIAVTIKLKLDKTNELPLINVGANPTRDHHQKPPAIPPSFEKYISQSN